MATVLVHYHEIALKAGNRPRFIGQLVANLRRATEGLGIKKIRKLSGRISLELPEGVVWESVADRIGRVFGVANFSLTLRTSPDLPHLKAAVEQVIAGREFQTFRVTAKRAFKAFPLTSQQINEEIGTHVLTLRPLRVNLSRPEVTIFIEVLPREAFVYLEKHAGLGGLPVGVAGRVVSLISGGIDSPVAACRMMRRGCPVTFVHFHGTPFLDRRTQDKTRELVRILTSYQYDSRLYLVPFGEIQQEVVVNTPPRYRVILYRRLMVRIAERVAEGEGAKALVTGESLGQVASQTVENLAAIEDAVRLMVLRPLVGMDKDEISAQARQIGTFETSIEPDQDCCSLFVPRHPAVRTDLEEIRRVESALDVEALVRQGLEGATVEGFIFPPP
ncbi:MAG: tRNA uracil 4-sulfurtransferase ThiI [Candidatus Methylomirabilales bacterium]